MRKKGFVIINKQIKKITIELITSVCKPVVYEECSIVSCFTIDSWQILENIWFVIKMLSITCIKWEIEWGSKAELIVYKSISLKYCKLWATGQASKWFNLGPTSTA